MPLKIVALIIVILLSLPAASKLLTRIIWFLFPYSGVSLQLRTIIVGKLIRHHLLQEDESEFCYKNNFGRTCVVVPHKYHDGFASADIGYITEELFDLLARRLAKHFGYTRGAVSVKEDRSVFQFWNTHG